MAATTAERPPIGRVSPRQIVVLVLASALMVVGLVVIAPALADLPDVWSKLSTGHLGWLTFALILEALSFVGYAILFRAVSIDRDGNGTRIGFRASTEIALAGHAATRLFASAGAGGIALTAWALRKSGMEARDVAARMTTFMVLLYMVYMGALLFGGLGMYVGLIPGGGSFSLTIVPAIFGGAVIALVASAQLVQPGESRLRRWLAPVGQGVRDARRLIASGNAGLLGSLMKWGFDIACLWACFEAFGASPAFGALVLGYFIGMLANTLPLPGGVGGVDGGMIGAFIAFGVDPGTAIVAVLAYRFFSFWLPIAPGAVAFATLRRTVARWEAEDAGEREPERRKRERAHRGALCHQYS
ncbi:flippase-like domain-containing protein [Solirubrobacter sp. CPCC 204708]|uniref:Flippase-like domain-containing protein n=1 Tax=Solirubrobacter deserti TaxID=2282478 RepID=A0ABT4REN5_9ACTN|nr:lysylphosphatidylglycerol synthase transmembrane domain-containing protein [Solirubrobacter deserti]MBE2318527.1 flippase-like domain-containing protein [Solirubrobacter deserti]MDA0136985.1 flippase-like domain-containing protein [Solirubrobacter deserti]